MKNIKKTLLGTLVVLLSLVGLANIANAIDPIANHSQTQPADIDSYIAFCATCSSGGDEP